MFREFFGAKSAAAGPPQVLWVMVVTMGMADRIKITTEDTARHQAGKWAISTISTAPTSSAIWRIRLKLIARG